jgi:predicted nucleic acid-binding protein
MAHRRKRVTFELVEGFLTRLKALPIEAALQTPVEILDLPKLAQDLGLTNYDATYLALAKRLGVPLATMDSALRKASAIAGVGLIEKLKYLG